MLRRAAPHVALALALVACQGVIGAPSALVAPPLPEDVPPAVDAAPDGAPPADAAPPPPYEPAPAVLPRLTNAQYRNAASDLLDAPLPAVALEADTNPFLFHNLGAASATASQRGVEQWAAAAMTVTGAVFDDPARRAALVGCAPAAPGDACAESFLRRFGRRAFRRPLDDAELARLVGLARQLGVGDPWRGVRYATAAVLQAPSFLYRAELGEPDPTRPGRHRYSAWEMASRLSFTLWNSVPDEALLGAAARGELLTADGVRATAWRLLAHPRARASVRGFFAEYLGLTLLDGLARDRALFPRATDTLAASMREEVERMVEDVVFTRDVDLRTVFSTPVTFLDRELAGLYDVPLPASVRGFARVTLPTSSGRGGLLTTAAILALTSHPNATSPTGRGRYVRERLLCERVPDPPGNMPLNLDDGGPTPRTLRDRLALHRRAASCAACHAVTDPVGLGFEDFDALGQRRDTEAGQPVDARGDLDGAAFIGARALSELLSRDERVGPCVARQLFRYAHSRLDRDDDDGERALLDDLAARFAANGYRFQWLLVELVASDAFRRVRSP